MTSYAEIAAKNPTSATQSNKSRDSMESLGQVRRSPSSRDHFRAPPQMEDSVLLAEEVPTCNVERLLDASTPSDYYTILEEFDLKIIEDEDEAAAILARGNTRDLPTSTGNGNHELPGTSQGVNTHTGNSELPGTSQEGNNSTGNSPPNEATELPGTSPIDLERDQDTPHHSPISSDREWDTVRRKSKKSQRTHKPAFEDVIEGPPQNKNTKGIEWVFLTISTAARSAFPMGKIKQTVERFHRFIGKDNCNGVYPPQYRMGPTIKIKKNQLNKTKRFTMHNLGDLIFQANPWEPASKPKQTKNRSQSNSQENKRQNNNGKNTGIIKGISTDHSIRDLNNLFRTEQNNISKIERVTQKYGKITNAIKLTFKTALAPLKIGSELIGFFNVEPCLFSYLRCNYCQRFGHSTGRCRAQKPRCPHCAKEHTHNQCRSIKATKCANCGSNDHGAAYSKCPAAIKYQNEIDRKNTVIKNEHQKRIDALNTTNKSQKPAPTNKTTKVHKTPIPVKKAVTIKSTKKDQESQTNSVIDVDNLKKEIMLMTTKFILNKIGQPNQQDSEIKKEIEKFLNGSENKEPKTKNSDPNPSQTNEIIDLIEETVTETEDKQENSQNNEQTDRVQQKQPNTKKNKASKAITTSKKSEISKPYKKKDFLKINRQLIYPTQSRLKIPKNPKTPKSKSLFSRR